MADTQTVTIDYDCLNRCRYAIPTTLTGEQSALRHAPLVDTLAALADQQHKRECPTDRGKAAAA